MKNKKIIICITIGFLAIPIILGGVYLFNTHGLTVRKNPKKTKEIDVFEIKLSTEIGSNDHDEKDILTRWSFDSDSYMAAINSMFTMRDDCQVIEHFQLINDKKYSKHVTVMQHAPKILVDRELMSSAQKLIKFSDTNLNCYLTSYGIPYIETDKIKFNAFKTNNKWIDSYYLLKKGDDLQPYEKGAYDDYKDTVYDQIYVNNTIYYVEVNEKDYKLISKEEFENKAYGFDENTDLEKLIKKTSKIPKSCVWFMLGIFTLATTVIYYTYQNFKHGDVILVFIAPMLISLIVIFAWYEFSTVFAIISTMVAMPLLKSVYKCIANGVEISLTPYWQLILLGYIIGSILPR